jgi:hypothetical protein
VRRIGLLAIAAGSAAVVASTAPARPSPVLEVMTLRPVTVRGTGFHPGERLTVVLWLAGRNVRTVRAARRGSFVVRFQEYADLCAAYTLRVLSAQRVRAAVRHRAPPSCAALDPVP